MDQALLALATVVLAAFGCLGWIWGAGRVVEALWPARAGAIRPWLFLAPALAMLAVWLVWPVFATVWLSLQDADGRWIGAGNYRWLAADMKFREALGNTLLWLAIVPAVSTALGLFAARLTEGLRWRGLARAMIFLPVVISFSAAAVIWKFIYDFRPETGLLNAMVEVFGGAPQAWLSLPFWNDLCLMAVLIWVQTGFAMVILAAALRTIPAETRAAAVLDGAGPWRLFLRIEAPQIRGAIAVVWTAITVIVLKVFDIVFVMTNGQWGTQVLANVMYDWMFRGTPDFGRGSAVAVVLMALALPVMIRSIWGAR